MMAKQYLKEANAQRGEILYIIMYYGIKIVE